MTFYGHHGDRKPERELGQRFEVDAEITYDATEAIRTNGLGKAINYCKVFELVEDVVVNNEYVLRETLAEHIAQAVLDHFDIIGLRLRVRKPRVPIRGNLDYVEVEIEREKGAVPIP
ncbi:MAG: dihydroneopterin aldolase [Gemmatimonadota bacterium]|nr:MAG: dihydroneopterin aldolase [Gemmatimonadota bacterium]